MFDFLPAGFDLNDVRFYSTLLVTLGLMAFTWRARRITLAQRAEDRRLALATAAHQTGVVGPVRARVRVR